MKWVWDQLYACLLTVSLPLSKKKSVILTSHLLFELQMSDHITHMDTENCKIEAGKSIWRELVKNEEHTLTVN